MSRSKRDQRGKRINGELGRHPKIIGDRVARWFGWDLVGSPIRKRDVKQASRRMQRRINRQMEKNHG